MICCFSVGETKRETERETEMEIDRDIKRERERQTQRHRAMQVIKREGDSIAA
jgi:hypothetical protein